MCAFRYPRRIDRALTPRVGVIGRDADARNQS